MKTIFDGKTLKRGGYERVIKKQATCVHNDNKFNDGLGLFLYINNYSDDIPDEWFTTDDYIDMELHFDINLIINSLIDGHAFVRNTSNKKDVTYVDVSVKKQIDILQNQLIKALHTISNLEFVSAEDHYGEKTKN